MFTAEIERWQPQARVRQVELSLEISDGLPNLQLDRARTSQALGNVLNNSIRCTRAGGHVLMSVDFDSDRDLAISVTDDEVCIDAGDQAHIFDRFYRSEGSQDHGIGSTGLGLAISKANVEAHGESLTLESDRPKRGTAVIVGLPLRE